MKNKVYAMEGSVILMDNGNKLVAVVDGKQYDTRTYRPVNGDGRQLRAENQGIITRLLPYAELKLREEMEAAAKTPSFPAAGKAGKYSGMTEEEIDNLVAVEVVEEKQRIFEEGVAEGKRLAANPSMDISGLTSILAASMKEALAPLYPKAEEPKTFTKKSSMVYHSKFDNIMKIMQAPEAVVKSNSKYFYLHGPAGTGKSTLARQVAEALHVPFYSTGSVFDVFGLLGFIGADREYSSTDFFTAFSKGGLFFFDEFDISDESAVKKFNDMLASRVGSFPCGMVEAHPDFYCMAAGNTTGRGATLEYTGSRMDASTMNRFRFLEVNYDERIERNIVEEDEELLNFCHEWRQATKKARVSSLFTYRNLEMIHSSTKLGIDTIDALDMDLFAGLEEDDIRIIHAAGDVAGTSNKYWKAIEARIFQ